jgi:tryptophan synthase alpha subunit
VSAVLKPVSLSVAERFCRTFKHQFFYAKGVFVHTSNPLLRYITEINKSGRVALCGYFLTGFKSPRNFFSCIRNLQNIDVFEFGIPSENPFLDGPDISDAHSHVTDTIGLNCETALSLLGGLKDTVQPRFVMTYAEEGRELDGFLRLCLLNGIHGILVPDLTIDEANRIALLTASMNLACIGFIHDGMDNQTIERTVSFCEMVYLKVSSGPTGQKGTMDGAFCISFENRITHLRSLKKNLIITAGIGIQTPEQVRLLSGFDINMVVVGTSLIQKMCSDLTSLHEYTRQLHEATCRKTGKCVV